MLLFCLFLILYFLNLNVVLPAFAMYIPSGRYDTSSVLLFLVEATRLPVRLYICMPHPSTLYTVCSFLL